MGKCSQPGHLIRHGRGYSTNYTTNLFAHNTKEKPERMSTATCKHGFPTPKACLDCLNDEGQGPPVNTVSVETSTMARYEGTCNRCNSAIRLGERIYLLSTGAWVCCPTRNEQR